MAHCPPWACSHLRAFALAVASVLNALFSDMRMAQSSPFILPKCYLIREPSLNTFRIPCAYFTLPLHLVLFFFRTITTIWNIIRLFDSYSLIIYLHWNVSSMRTGTLSCAPQSPQHLEKWPLQATEKSAQKIFAECWIRNFEWLTIASYSICKLHEIWQFISPSQLSYFFLFKIFF